MARTNNLIFEDAIKARDSITSSQRKDIVKLYEQWAKEIGKTAEKFGKKTNSSAPLSEAYMNQLKKQLETTGKNVASNVEKKIKDNMLVIADNVIADNAKWLKNMGFSKGKIDAAFSYVPNDVVERLVTGKVYQSGWSLSKAIWGDSKDTLSKVYEIIAGGFAKQQSIYEIAKDLESFVSPSAKKMWNLTDKDGRKIYPKMVDYSAQRLARTLAQHTYQQAFQEATKDNPFVLKYKWVSNGSRVCDICKKRDGKLFDKDKLPMDHPNGMCVMEPVTMNKQERLDRLTDWVKGKDGDYPEIDAFAKKLGFDSKSVQTGSKGASKARPKTTTAKTETASKKVANNTKTAKQTRLAPKTKFSNKLIKHLNMDKKSSDAFNNVLNKLPDTYRNVVTEMSKKIQKFSSKPGVSYFLQPGYKMKSELCLDMNSVIASAVKYGRSSIYNAFYHEMGHVIDYYGSNGPKVLSQSDEFINAMKKDLQNLSKMISDGSIYASDLVDVFSDADGSGIQDIVSGAKYLNDEWASGLNKIRCRWSHSKEYWVRSDLEEELSSELFAHLSASIANDVETEYMQEAFPNALKEFNKIISQISIQ